MLNFSTYIILFDLFFTSFVQAAPKSTSYREVMTVTNTVFINQFKEAFTSDFCDERSPFMKCFNVEPKQCTTFIETKTEDCSKKLKLPKQIRIDLQGTRVGELMGRCLGRSFVEKHKNRKIVNDYCERRDQWIATIQ